MDLPSVATDSNHSVSIMDAIAHLSKTSWCRALIEDPAWTPTKNETRVPKASTEDSFFAETLGTQRTIRNYLTLRPSQPSEDQDAPEWSEVRTIVELGDGLNGHPEICHGGFVATMLDEVLGQLVIENLPRRTRKARDKGLGPHEGMNVFTVCESPRAMWQQNSWLTDADLNTNYRRPVPTPGIVLCTARHVRQERSKTYVTGTIEDGQGTIYATAESMFIEVRSQSKL
jgi:thioesterase superfamily protein 4